MGIRHARLATALLTTTALGVGAIEIQANLAARAELRHLLDTHHGLAISSVFAEPLSGRLTLRGITSGTGDTRVTIGTLNLPLARQGFGLISTAAASPFDDKTEEAKPDEAKPDESKPDESKPDEAKPDQPAPAAEAPVPAGTPGTAIADNVTITRGTTVFHIKHIELTGTPLSNADLAAMVDPGSTETLETRLKKLTAEAINVPEIIAEDSTDASKRKFVMSQVLITGATAGKLATGSAGGVTLAVQDGTSHVDGSVGPIQATGVDLGQIVHVFGGGRTDDAEPILPLYESLTVTAMKLTNAERKVVVSLAALNETGVKARPLKMDLVAASKAGPLTDAQQKALIQDIRTSIEIGELKATDMAATGDNDASFSLVSLSLKGFAKSKIDGFTMRALAFVGPKVKVSLGTVDIGPLAVPAPSDAPNAMMPASAKLDMGAIDVDVETPEKETVRFKVAHAGIVSDGAAGDLPTSSKITVDNVTFDLPPNSAQAQPLLEMGYHHLDISMGLATTYDAAGQSLKFQDLTLNGANMGSVALGLHLVNVTKGLISPNQDIVKASLVAILAKGMTLDLVNDGLIDKVLAWKAKQDGVDVAKTKADLVDFFANKLPASANNAANAKLVGAAIAKFVTDPKNLHISVESKSGLGVGSMALLNDPGVLIDALDVKATANQ